MFLDSLDLACSLAFSNILALSQFLHALSSPLTGSIAKSGPLHMWLSRGEWEKLGAPGIQQQFETDCGGDTKCVRDCGIVPHCLTHDSQAIKSCENRII